VSARRGIERRCREDVAFRVITANQVPDHATIARFRVRHERALGGLFGQVLGLCADAGLGDARLLAVDGTRLAALPRITPTEATTRSPARSSPGRARSMVPRTSATATPEATSFPSG